MDGPRGLGRVIFSVFSLFSLLRHGVSCNVVVLGRFLRDTESWMSSHDSTRSEEVVKAKMRSNSSLEFRLGNFAIWRRCLKLQRCLHLQRS